MSSIFVLFSLDIRINAKSEWFSSVCTRDISSGVAARALFPERCFFSFFFSIWRIRLRDHWAEKNRSFHTLRCRTIGDKRKAPNCARALSAACFFDERKTRTRKHEYTRIYTHPRIHTRPHTHTSTRLYTAYKMNARRHTLDGDRTKLATGVLTYRQIELIYLF